MHVVIRRLKLVAALGRRLLPKVPHGWRVKSAKGLLITDINGNYLIG